MTHLELQQGEVILREVRKHWLVLLRDTIGILVAAIVPLVAIAILGALGAFASLSTSGAALWVYIAAAWGMACFIALSVAWTHYILDTWIVTDRRVIYIEQISLFNRQVVTLRMERVQDVTVQVNGLLETLFGLGTLQVQSAGAIAEYTTIEGIRDPYGVKDLMLRQVDKCTDAHMSALRSGTSRTHDTHDV